MLAHHLDAPVPPPLTLTEKWRRSLNKLLGRPATIEVGILAEMLLSLRDQSVDALSPSFGPSFRLDLVVVTHPPLRGLRGHDLADALEHAGLRSWLDPPMPGQGLKAGVYPMHLDLAQAAFAADGNGLCKTYRNLFACENEEEEMPFHVVLTASFTRQALYIAAGVIQAPFHWTQFQDVEATDLNLGLNSMTDYPSPNKFWENVGKRLRDVALEGLDRTETGYTKVLLLGENATHPDFLKVLRDSTFDLVEPRNIGETAFTNPVFAVARGAAQYARIRQEAPFGCREMDECEEKRRKESCGTWEGYWLGEVYSYLLLLRLIFPRILGLIHRLLLILI